MNIKMIKAVQLHGSSQPLCNFWSRFECVDICVRLNSECGQAVNACIRPHVENRLCSFRHGLPTPDDFFLYEIGAEIIKLPLHHFCNIAGHLEATILQYCHT